MQIISRKKSHGGVDKKPRTFVNQPSLGQEGGEVSIGLAGKRDDDASSVVQA
jgi:hypothetical protein